MARVKMSRSANFKSASQAYNWCTVYLIFYITQSCLCNIENIDLNYTHPLASFDELYSDGIAAYSAGKWKDAIRSFELAISDYRHELDVKTHCRMRCKGDLKKDATYKSTDFDENLLLLYYSIRLRRCSDLCEEKFMGRRPPVARFVRDAFEKREPYNYLQFAYFQSGSIKKAAEAALTYLEVNQQHEVMKKNLEFYVADLGVSNKTIKSMEALPFVELYQKGDQFYQNRDYHGCVEMFEDSLTEYYKAINKCHILCEYQHEKHQASFSVALFDHFTAILKCRRTCDQKLSIVGAKTKQGMLEDHYHYLQFCYFEIGRVRDAATCAKTFLEFSSKDPIMSENMMYYNELLAGDSENVFPRENAMMYLKEKRIGDKLISAAKQFMDPNELFASETSETDLEDIELKAESKPDETTSRKGDKDSFNIPEDTEMPPMRRSTESRNSTRWQDNPDYKGMNIFLSEQGLNGTERVAVDNLVTQEECDKLMDLVERLAIDGDGYKSTHTQPSRPFTDKETFKGVNIVRAAQAVYQGLAKPEELELYLNISKKALKFTEDYFDLRKPLHFAFTHLVCRTALPEAAEGDPFDPEAVHLSHPVHSDNCLLGADGFGTCPKRLPAYTWRDYSAILYLNSDFEGGEFVFADHKQNIQSMLPVKCGRLVSFSAGFENLHGVLGVRKGKRCALPLWFTFSGDKAETQRSDAEAFLKRIKKSRAASEAAKEKMRMHGAFAEEDAKPNESDKMTKQESSPDSDDIHRSKINGPDKHSADVGVSGERSEL